MLQGPDGQDGSLEPVLQLPLGRDRQRLPEVQVLLRPNSCVRIGQVWSEDGPCAMCRLVLQSFVAPPMHAEQMHTVYGISCGHKQVKSGRLGAQVRRHPRIRANADSTLCNPITTPSM